MAYSPQTSDWSSIALAVKARLVESLDLDAAYVKIVASDSYRLLAEDRFVFIRFWGPSPYTECGAGRWFTPVTRLFRVYLYVRDSNDEFSTDNLALTGASGLSAFEESVYESLVQWTPLDDGDSPLTIEPLHPIDSSSGPPIREPENDVGFLRSHLMFECKYGLKVTQTHVP